MVNTNASVATLRAVLHRSSSKCRRQGGVAGGRDVTFPLPTFLPTLHLTYSTDSPSSTASRTSQFHEARCEASFTDFKGLSHRQSSHRAQNGSSGAKTSAPLSLAPSMTALCGCICRPVVPRVGVRAEPSPALRGHSAGVELGAQRSLPQGCCHARC